MVCDVSVVPLYYLSHLSHLNDLNFRIELL
jgi:hypothetical protein